MNLKGLAGRLAKEVVNMSKESAIDRLLGEIEHGEIRESAKMKRIEALKNDAGTKSHAPPMRVTKHDIKQTAKLAGAAALGTFTASIDHGDLSFHSLAIAAGLGLSVFLNRLLTNGG